MGQESHLEKNVGTSYLFKHLHSVWAGSFLLFQNFTLDF